MAKLNESTEQVERKRKLIKLVNVSHDLILYRCRLYFRPLSRILAGVTEYLFKGDPTVCFRFRYSAFLLNRKP